ncbi:hypothetical protein OWV82_020307 [Melia azedarach]|uniref:Uncharacterized protein n=1 Tax=Melia azedarach TaxID=155640 RepID=A0ACC1X5S1_MELAZ|nr:hypothetical protein OWV82_020307 [Melia azedarach]
MGARAWRCSIMAWCGCATLSTKNVGVGAWSGHGFVFAQAWRWSTTVWRGCAMLEVKHKRRGYGKAIERDWCISMALVRNNAARPCHGLMLHGYAKLSTAFNHSELDDHAKILA